MLEQGFVREENGRYTILPAGADIAEALEMCIRDRARRMVTLPQEHDSFASALFEESLLKMFVILVPVSYTHLDVYKRQPYNRVRPDIRQSRIPPYRLQ